MATTKRAVRKTAEAAAKKNTNRNSTSAKKNGIGNNKSEKSDQVEDLKGFLESELRDLYNAEKQLVAALPKMKKAATSEELAGAFETHLEETRNHVSRLEQVFDLLGFPVKAKKCEAMEGLITESKDGIDATETGSVLRDVALIISAQKAEHYEIAAYGSLRNIARILGEDDAADLLQETLDEEGSADKKLTQLSESINPEAFHKDDEDEEDNN